MKLTYFLVYFLEAVWLSFESLLDKCVTDKNRAFF